MDLPRSVALRVPAVVLGTVIVLAGLATLPSILLFLATIVAKLRGGNWSGEELVTYVLPALAGYAVAIALWFRSRRTVVVNRSWLLATVGVLIVVAVSYRPVAAVAEVAYEQWQQTQPGGRGYYP